ncbi:MAG TPA: hypothetical protein VLH12_08405 [Usitatibacter sp.]|nr:hypothetical protein [Usitatibacter sp.]
MDRDNPARDILPNSYWDANGVCVQVLSTGGGYVRAWDGSAVQHLHHVQFRIAFREVYDRRAFRSQFSMSLCNLDEFHAFFSPSVRNRFFARCVTRSPEDAFTARRGQPALPPDCVFVGTYAKSFSASSFLDDIDAIVERILGASAAAKA